MADEVAVALPEGGVKNHGWIVTFAGMGVNLALGVLYSWSVISRNVPKDWGWSQADKSWPYSVACLIFSLVMVPAGRMQDRIGPRIVATIGGILVGAGMVLAFITKSSLAGYVLGFGLLAGSGIGFGYASATPPAVKWFPAARTGLIAGLVVSGFGLASVYIAPLAQYLIGTSGIPSTMLVFGVGFLMIVVGLAQVLKPPPKGYVPAGTPVTGPGAGAARKEDFTPSEMLRTWQFYLLWFMYTCGAGAGLMIISKMADIAKLQARIELGFILVACLAVGNGAGRIAAGVLSDRIGRKMVLFICFIFQAVLLAVLSQAKAGSFLTATPAVGMTVMVIVSALIGANYGANLSLFPSVTKDYYGLKNFGVNYGLVFTAWGLGGFMLSLLAGWVYDHYKTFLFAYICSIVLLAISAMVVFVVKPPQHRLAAEGQAA